MVNFLMPLIVLCFIFALTGAAHADDVDIGRAEFQSSCASCHGASGKGDGPVSSQLKVPPKDLTTLEKDNGGVFPADNVYEIIDGRRLVPAHGTRQMPIWGERFNPIMNIPHIVDPAYDALDPSRDSRELVVRRQILAVLNYLKRMQQK